MENLFIYYPRCSTCVKAKKHLINSNQIFKERHIIDENPTKEELSDWISKYNLDIKKLFNTSGVLYKELGLKDKIKTLSNDQLLDLLSSNGKLIKRPLLIGNDTFLIGYKEEEYNNFM